MGARSGEVGGATAPRPKERERRFDGWRGSAGDYRSIDYSDSLALSRYVAPPLGPSRSLSLSLGPYRSFSLLLRPSRSFFGPSRSLSPLLGSSRSFSPSLAVPLTPSRSFLLFLAITRSLSLPQLGLEEVQIWNSFTKRRALTVSNVHLRWEQSRAELFTSTPVSKGTSFAISFRLRVDRSHF